MNNENQVNLKNLPTWDLSDLYAGFDDSTLELDLSQASRDASRFAKKYTNKIADLGGDNLAEAIAEYERLDEILSKVMSYAQLAYAADLSSPEVAGFYQRCQEQVNAISVDFIFFTLELNELDEDALQKNMQASTKLDHYRPWLRDVRAMQPHLLSDELEKLLHEKAVAGRSAWIRLFDETLSGLRFPFRGEMLTNTEILNLMSDADGDKRKEAARSLGQVLSENSRTFSLITNTLAKDKEIEDKWRKFDRPVSSRNLSNYVEDEVVDALVKAVKSSYPDLSHRYYKLKAKWFGKEKIDYWDRLAPLPDEDDSLIAWEDARDVVLDAYARFSPKLSEIGTKFFENDWIDAQTRDGKSSGAFAHPVVPSAHPYLLVNYLGKTRDVMTLAHELGHGVHQVLAGDQGQLMADTPLTLAETASVFGEMLTFQKMLSTLTDPKARRAMLASKIEDMLNTVVRQVAFYEFERIVHETRRSGELTADQLGDIWLSISEESLGDAIRFDDDYKSFWAYIPHFIHSPFYVYAYAFGDCLVNSLYSKYSEAEEGFAEKYLDMLKAGGTLRHKELLAPFGLDASDPEFWKQGLSVLSGFIDELEKTFDD